MIQVVLIGPESSGKTELAKYLSNAFSTTWAPEYLRTFFNEKKAVFEENMLGIAQNQLKNEKKATQNAKNVVFFDTNLLTLNLYHKLYFKKEPTWFNHLFEPTNYNHYFLLKPDIPWVDDGQRDMPRRREELFELFELELQAINAAYTIISGHFEERQHAAIQKVNELLAKV